METTITDVLDEVHSYGCGSYEGSVDGILESLEDRGYTELLRKTFGFFCWEDVLSWQSERRLKLPF